MGRFFGWMSRLVSGAVLVAVFCVSVLAGALLHLDLRAVRRIVEGRVNAVLSSLPENRARITGLTRLTTQGARVDAVDVDIERVALVHAENVRVDVGLVRTLRDVLLARQLFHDSPAQRVGLLGDDRASRQRGVARRRSRKPAPAKPELHLDVSSRRRLSRACPRAAGERARTSTSIANGHPGKLAASSWTRGGSPSRPQRLRAVCLPCRCRSNRRIRIGAPGFGRHRCSAIAARAAQVTLVARAGDARARRLPQRCTGIDVAAEVTAPETAVRSHSRPLVPAWPLDGSGVSSCARRRHPVCAHLPVRRRSWAPVT